MSILCDEPECDLPATYWLDVVSPENSQKKLILKCLEHGKHYNKTRPKTFPKLARLYPGKCEVPGCNKFPYYRSPIAKFHTRSPKRCYAHAKESDVNIVPRMCINCLYRVGTHGKRNTKSTAYCYVCAKSFSSLTNNVSLKLIDYVLDKIDKGDQKKIQNALDCFLLMDILTGDAQDESQATCPSSEVSPALVAIEDHMKKMSQK